MLDAIADFWKPVKKQPPQVKLTPELLQTGSSLGFGFVPQAMLSGRRLYVIGINTYMFGEDKLISFVLSHDKNPEVSGPHVSMIVAQSEDEYYLAISRRISINDRARLFEASDLNNVITKPDVTRLTCRDNIVDFKGWVVASYKREIQGMRGSVAKGDFRNNTQRFEQDNKQDFEYTLLVSESNEHAIEIEKYPDGRLEVYATVYRRMGDVGEIMYNTPVIPETIRPDIKLSSAPQLVTKEPVKEVAKEVAAEPVIAPQVVQTAIVENAKTTPIALEVLTPLPVVVDTAQTAKENTNEQPSTNGVTTMTTAEVLKPKLYVQANGVDMSGSLEVKAAKENSFDSEAIECDLRVANKIIDEAIRNEMRLTDVVRRIIELPVANPESVQIPLTLSDEDYALLAIRYGISASDRNAIKRRIIADLGDFSGDKKKAA